MKYSLLKNFFKFTDSRTGSIGIDISFKSALPKDYQLIAYATFPKVVMIDKAGDCQLVDNT